MVKREAVLTAAAQLITGDRAEQYGDAYTMHSRIADIWSAMIGHPINASQVAYMLAGMKLARLARTPKHFDSSVDAAGYIALGAEMAGE